MRIMRAAAAVAAALSLFALGACGHTEASENQAATTTIEHAFGSTQVPQNPERVATVAWSNQDAALALDVVPVGFPGATWGVEDDSRQLAWTKSKLDELGAQAGEDYEMFDETDGIDFEAVSKSDPDVILAAYSGLTQEDYDKLSAIAPTVAYPEKAWGTSWRDTIKLNAQAMGKQAAGEELVADLEKQIQDVTSGKDFAGKTAAFFYGSSEDMSTLSYYTAADPRTAYLYDLGFSEPESVKKASAESDSFYVEVSAENVDQLADVDVIVMYGGETQLSALQNDKLLGQVPAIKNGAIAWVPADGAFAASVNPTALSVPYGLDRYVDLLSEAAAKAE